PMNVMMVRAKIKTESVADVESGVHKMFAAIEAAHPNGVRYASCRTPDGETFVALLELEDSSDNPLVHIPAFTEFQSKLKDWVAGPPTPERLEVVGSYRLFD
ncbi:MAG TPA: hypothetical protein VFA70_13470, partial [Dehalococcoidia bacterium]|nr:hypothetical protein [Dehalococcoidia bacterium]